MSKMFIKQSTLKAISITPVVKDNLESWLSMQSQYIISWVKNTRFKAKSGSYCLIANDKGELESVLLGLKDETDFRAFGALPGVLPEGVYVIQGYSRLEQAALGWALGYYQFSRYKESESRSAQLLLPTSINVEAIEKKVVAINISRDLINTPAEDMGPDELEDAVKSVAKEFSASVKIIKGDKLLKENYPAVHAVGRASSREPRVIDLTWGDKNAPKVTLVGKGVCFDSGGLDIKNASGMLLMKKDMGGAAMMLGLAHMIMSHNLPVRLRLMIGAVENSVAGNSYKPGDVIRTGFGKTVEINNTDAEGRLVLCDMLAQACTENPEVLINFATLTGAGRIALGRDVPAMFSHDDKLADEIFTSSKEVNDLVWRLPLIDDYNEHLQSYIADLSNCSDTPWGGSITAALFLQAFVDKNVSWAHFDIPAWNFSDKPARPKGGEVFGVRAVFNYLENKYRK